MFLLLTLSTAKHKFFVLAEGMRDEEIRQVVNTVTLVQFFILHRRQCGLLLYRCSLLIRKDLHMLADTLMVLDFVLSLYLWVKVKLAVDGSIFQLLPPHQNL